MMPFLLPKAASGGGGGDITTGLLHWWKFDEGTGATAADSGSSPTNITLNYNNPASWTTGMIGPYAFASNGGSAGYANNATNIDLSGSYTLAGWVNKVTGGTGNQRVVCLSDTTHGIYLQIVIYFSGSTNDINIATTDGSSVYGTVSNLVAWNHYAAVMSGSTIVAFYINGSVVSSARAAGTFGTNIGNPGVMVGARADHSSVYDNWTDDLRFYTRQLSSADVATLYAYR